MNSHRSCAVLAALDSGHDGQEDFLTVQEVVKAELLLQLRVCEGRQLLARLDVFLHFLAVHVQSHAVEPRADDIRVPLEEGNIRLEGDGALVKLPAQSQLAACTGPDLLLREVFKNSSSID